MQVKYCCTYWGCEKDKPDVFIEKVLSAGYEGIELYLPSASDEFAALFMKELNDVRYKNPDFIFIAQQLTSPDNQTVDEYICRMEKSINELAALQPSFINSHTGKDYYSFDDNCKVIEAALTISSKTGVRILHETHRGRFSFHAASLIAYLKKFPELELVGDFSHFCTVSESMLQDQTEIIEQIIPHVSHLHARIGHEQAPQVNDPFAPEWKNHFALFEGWWQQIIDYKKETGLQQFSITPEFGPFPYMPMEPYTQRPLGNQWEINCKMMQHLKRNIQTS
jgi:sugar phosphate isomerase/epimerase